MSNPLLSDPWAATYQQLLSEIFANVSPAMQECSDEPEHFDELELQARWFAGDFGRKFIGVDGQSVEIIQFGEWNRGAGPDFQNTVVKIDADLRKGDLEIDSHVSDWDKHGHSTNTHFENVILHIFVGAPANRRYFTRDHLHRSIPQVRVDPSTIDPARWLKQQAIARIGRCATPLAQSSAGDVDALLQAAARYRVHRKAQRFHRIAQIHGKDQALFQSVAEVLGYHQNKLAMVLLSQRLPVEYLRKNKSEVEALLFGHSGFLQKPNFDESDPDARTYLRQLWESWWKHRPSQPRAIPWAVSGTRPINHPQRRIGALTAILAQWNTLRPLLLAEPDFSPKKIKSALSAVQHDFWNWHFTLASARAKSRMALVGASRIADLMGNLCFPIAITRPENTQSAWNDYRKLRAELGNAKLKRAAIRILGLRSDAVTFQKKYFQQQGLLQIYDDFCLIDESDCDSCPFPEQLSQWKMTNAGAALFAVNEK